MSSWEDGFKAGWGAAMGYSPDLTQQLPITPKVKKARSAAKKARKRKPSAYNRFMKKELKRLRKKHPRTPQTSLFVRAAKAWRRQKK